MKEFLKKIVLRPVTICVLVVIVMVLGVIGVTGMPVNLMPQMNMPFLAITTAYPGASATAVDADVTSVIESKVKTVSGINKLTTNSYDNVSVVVAEFDYGTDLKAKQDEIEEKFSLIDLPDNCYEPTFTTVDFNATAVATISLYRADNDIDQIIKDANLIADKFYAIEGVGQVSIIGLPETKIELKSLEGLDISIMMVAQSLMNEGNLDIPFGNIFENGNNASIKNESSATSIEELSALPVRLEFANSIWSALESLNDTMTSYEEATVDEVQENVDSAKKARDFMQEMDSSTAEEAEELANDISGMASIMNLVRNNTDVTLKIMWNQVIEPLSKDEAFLNATEADLEQLSKQYDIDVDLLRNLQTYAKDGTLKDKWDIIVNFRKQYPEEITYEQFADLFIDLESVEYDPNSPTKEEDKQDIIDACEFADSINTLAFDDIVESKKEGEAITDEQYSALFIGSSYAEDSPLLVSPQFINIVRQSTFDQNCESIVSFKQTHLDEDNNPRSLTDQEFLDLYNSLVFEEEMDVTLSLDMIHLVRTLDYDNIKASDSENSYLIVKVDDLCEVNYVTTQDNYAEYNGSVAAIIKVFNKSDGANTSATVSQVKDIIAKSNLTSKMFLLDDQAEFINASISNILSSIAIGGLLAIIVIFAFLKKVRTSLVIAITMPLSVLAALLALYLMGTSLNMVSLGGMAVGIGMLVDNSIVVIESITKKRDENKNIYQSAIEGTKEVAGSLLASTLTTVCVFFPILLTQGLTREIFTDLSWAVIFSITFSLIVSIAVIPTLYCLVYRKEMNKEIKENIIIKSDKNKKVKNKFDIEAWYKKHINKLLKRKGIICIVAMLTFAGSLALISQTGTEFLPPSDKKLLEVHTTYTSSTKIDVARNDALNSSNLIRENIDDIKFIAMQVGADGMLTTSTTSIITIQLEEKAKSTNDVAQDIRNLLSNSPYQVEVVQIDGIVASLTSGVMSNLSVSLLGEDFETLKQIANEAKPKLLEINGIESVYNDATDTSMEYLVHIDRNKCAENNIDYATIVATLRAGIAGYDVSTIKLNGTDLTDISVIFNDNTLSNMESISNILIGADSDGNILKLKDISTIEKTNKTSVITKEDGKYILTLSFETYGIDTGTASKNVIEVLKPILNKYEGYTYEESGINSYLTDTFGGLVIALIAAFFLLFGVMACQFESLIKPFIVIMSIPFSFTGGFLALYLTGVSLSVVSFIGLIMLMGVVVNNAIVMIDKIDLLISEGVEPVEAVKEGASSRLRAILMTTLTTVLGLVPLALGLGDGGELMQPLGVVVIGGLTLSTLVTLILIPGFYCIIKRIKTKNI